MCDINLQEIQGNLDAFTASFEDCNGNAGVANFELLEGNIYAVNGTATDDSQFSTEIEAPQLSGYNPTKVFKYIAKKLKEILCPTCM
jgi:hypothetical protein